MGRVQDRVVIVTGGAGGMGVAACDEPDDRTGQMSMVDGGQILV
jgi:NADP-dependent 3-hydroxy acid dehydrogenase YdfG